MCKGKSKLRAVNASSIRRSNPLPVRQGCGFSSTPELHEVFEQLRAALHEHNERLRKLSTELKLLQRRRSG